MALETEQLRLNSSNTFAVVLVSSMEKDRGLADAGKWLVSTMARARNSGMRYDENRQNLLEVGSAPIELEPVVVELQIRRKSSYQVQVLDHSGAPTGNFLKARGKKIRLDGSRTGAIYYEIDFSPRN